MTDPSPHDVTAMLARLAQRDSSAVDALLPLLYDELRALASRQFARASPARTLQPTALVHEVYLKLTRNQTPDWEGRAHFLAVAAKAMRQILANHAEAKRAQKRGGGRPQVTLTGIAARDERPVDLLDLEQALAKLAELSPEQAQIVELRFLGGVEEREIALVLGISERSVRRKWRMARAFLECELGGGGLG
jgi:RNA polymerase sigma factor (TIGR02999 family)